MLVTMEILDNFGPCRKARNKFAERFPDGIDISGLLGTEQEADAVWKQLLGDEFLKRHIGWAICAGLLPARVRANLSGADLTGADLSLAYLTRADLRGADLTGADLSLAYLSGAYLSWAIWNEDTSWPDGFEPPKAD